MNNRYWSYIKKNKVISLFNLIVILIFLFPYNYVLTHTYETDEMRWKSKYLLTEFYSVVTFLPLIVFTIGFQVVKNKFWVKTFLILNAICCLFYLIISVPSLLFPIVDFFPSISNYLVPVLFPLVIWIYRIRARRKAIVL